MDGLSILIPTYNYCCVDLVRALHEQACLIGQDFEIIVADDGSTDQDTILANKDINKLSHCRYLICQQNKGRSAIRNYLSQQSIFPWLLFIDSDMVVCRPDFISHYLSTQGDVIDGGVVIGGSNKNALRYLYESATASEHTAEKRRENPYHDFHTANFMIRRELMLRYPFDERYSHYGYEDVAFGITLKENGIGIRHIDNPMSFEVFEDNEEFVQKTEEGLRTLYEFRHELQDYSRLLKGIRSLPRFAIWLIRFWHHMTADWERRQLTGRHPWLPLFKIYKMGYYLCYAKRQSSSTNH